MIDSIRKGVVIILSTNSHMNVMECIIKKNVMKGKGNSVVLINNTIALLLLSFSFFSFFFFVFFSFILFSHCGHKHTHRLTSIKEKKRGIVQFFSSTLTIQFYKEEYDFDIFFYFNSCLLLLHAGVCKWTMFDHYSYYNNRV
jgi:hypothetical protein